MRTMRNVCSETGSDAGNPEEGVRLSPESPSVFTTLDSARVGDDPESVLGAEIPQPGVGDSSSCHSDQTAILHHVSEVTPDRTAAHAEAAPAEALENVIADARLQTMQRVVEILQSSSLVRMARDVDELIRTVTGRAMQVVRPWIAQQAHVSMKPTQFSVALHQQIDSAAQQVVRELQARMPR